MANKTPSIAIVGAGMGGLAAAATLRQVGIDVTVYEQARQFAREDRHQHGAQDTARYAQQHETGAARHALGRGQHDAHDQACFNDFAKNNEKRGQHYSAITTPLAVPKNSPIKG